MSIVMWYLTAVTEYFQSLCNAKGLAICIYVHHTCKANITIDWSSTEV